MSLTSLCADGSPLRLPRWLHDHFGITFGTAREKVRTARALGSLPLIDSAFREGQLSYSKVRALTRVATAQNEDELLADSLGGREASAPVDRHQVVVHVAAETLAKTEFQGSAQDIGENVPAGTLLHPETIRRLACDGGLVSRDRHCQLPACSQDRYVEGQHIVHWAKGGETKLTNLVLLCSRHHRAVHELGYRIRCATKSNGLGKGTAIEFVKPGSG